MQPILLLCLVPWVAGAPGPKDSKDVVELATGKSISGRVVYEGRDELIVKSGNGEIEVARADVSSVHSIERALADFLKKFDALNRDDAGAVGQLAQWCAEQNLPHEARNLWLRNLLRGHGDDPEALKACTARRSAKTVQIKAENLWLDVEKYNAKKGRFRDAIVIPTAHFDIETDAEIAPLLDAAVQIERHYVRFYQSLGPELVLHVFDERPVIRAYANAGDMPQSWSGEEHTWFGAGENVLHVLVEERLDLTQLVRSITDMLLFNACRRSSGKTGQVPGWVASAISEIFAATAPSVPFGPWSDFGRPVTSWFQVQANDPKPVELKTLLRSSLGEMRRGPDAARRTAAAYTLGHFLARGDDGAHRDELFAYLRGAWLGKISSTDFLKAIGLNEKELSARWKAHVDANAS